MEKEKGREGVRDGGRGVFEKYFLVFTRCSRSVFLHLYGVLEGERHGAVLLSSFTVLTGLSIHLFKPGRVLQRTSVPNRFLC